MNPYAHHEFAAHEQMVFCHDPASGLRAIIALHSTRLGPAAGGVRMWPYESFELALTDALRLSRAMSYKNALAGLPLGGGKSVIVGDPTTDKTPELLRSFASHVQRLGGTYWCAEDVGMGVDDIEVLGNTCDYVFGLPGQVGDPSPHTATGVFMGMRAAVEHRFGEWESGIRVAVQGVGNVGYHLCEALHRAGAELVVSDVSQEAAHRVAREFDAAVIGVDEIYAADVEVFAPCALGATLNEQTIYRLHASVVAGSANNQLATKQDGVRLHERGVVYAPDFLVNAGGMLSVGGTIFGDNDPEQIPGRLQGIHAATKTLLERSELRGIAPSEMASLLATELIAAAL